MNDPTGAVVPNAKILIAVPEGSTKRMCQLRHLRSVQTSPQGSNGRRIPAPDSWQPWGATRFGPRPEQLGSRDPEEYPHLRRAPTPAIPRLDIQPPEPDVVCDAGILSVVDTGVAGWRLQPRFGETTSQYNSPRVCRCRCAISSNLYSGAQVTGRCRFTPPESPDLLHLPGQIDPPRKLNLRPQLAPVSGASPHPVAPAAIAGKPG